MSKSEDTQLYEQPLLSQEEIAKRNEEIKKHFISYGILTGILAAMMMILLLFTIISRKSWRNGLREEVIQVLEQEESSYKVGDWVKLSNPFTTSSGVYKISEKGNSNKWLYAIIIRITTLYGPAGAVYVYDLKSDKAVFMGFADIKSDVVKQLTENSRYSQINYWQKRIPSILKGSLGEKEEVKQ